MSASIAAIARWMSPIDRSHPRGQTLAVLAGTVAVLAGTATIIRQTTSGGGEPPPAGTANIWIDTDGGNCVDSPTPIVYANLDACTWSEAVATCEGGDTAKVMGGNYGDVNLTSAANNGRSSSSRCTVATETGQTVTGDELSLGHWSGSVGTSFLNIIGPMTWRTGDNNQNDYVTFDDLLFDANNTVAQVFVIQNATNITVRNSEIRESCAGAETGSDGAMIISDNEGRAAPHNLVFDNNLIHDAIAGCGGADPHSECMYMWGNDNLTLTRNHFYRCVFFDVFVTGEFQNNDNEADDYFIENNVFEMPCTGGACTTYGGGNPAIKTRDGGFPDPACVNWTVRFNIFVTGPQCNNPSGVVMRGNVFLGGNPCGSGGVTSTYNAFTSGLCGSNSISNAEATYDNGWTGGSARWPGDFTLKTSSVLKNVGPTSDFPALDLPGNARFSGSAADMGPYEFQE